MINIENIAALKINSELSSAREKGIFFFYMAFTLALLLFCT